MPPMTFWTLSLNGIQKEKHPDYLKPATGGLGKLLNDNAAASAMLDRLLHRGRLLKFEGNSYRLKEASKRLAMEMKKK